MPGKSPRYWLWLTLGVPLYELAALIFACFFIFPQAVRPWFPIWIGGTFLVNVALSFLLYFFVRLSGTWSVFRSWLSLGFAALAAATCSASVNYILLIHFQKEVPGFEPNIFIGVILNLQDELWPFALLAAGLKLLRTLELAKLNEEAVRAARLAAQRAQLMALRGQLNPHFLFNSLNALSGLVLDCDDCRARQMMAGLVRFFDAASSEGAADMTTLEQELDMVRTYLEIEHVRYGNRLRLHIDFPEALGMAEVPCFLLQPLIENALKHAVALSGRPVTLTVSATRAGAQLQLAVEDDGDQAISAPGLGVGLKNVRERLRLLYGSEGALETTRLGPGYRASISMPLNFIQALPEPAEAPEPALLQRLGVA